MNASPISNTSPDEPQNRVRLAVSASWFSEKLAATGHIAVFLILDSLLIGVWLLTVWFVDCTAHWFTTHGIVHIGFAEIADYAVNSATLILLVIYLTKDILAALKPHKA
jgi:hypothetical protein